MATRKSSTTAVEPNTRAVWASAFAALVGLWVLISPLALGGSISSGTVLVSNVVAGGIIAVLAGYGAYSLRTTAVSSADMMGELFGVVAALVGVWILVSPFVLSGAITDGTPLLSTAVSGMVAFLLATMAAYSHPTPG